MTHSFFSVMNDVWNTVFELFVYVVMGAEA